MNTKPVLFQRRGDFGVVTLNRPKALNALNLDMVRLIADRLSAWKNDSAVRGVLFTGAGDKAFCAGGDLKDFYTARALDDEDYSDISLPETFFGAEYRLNHQLFHYPKPTIALMDGIVMGGGYGIAGHCDYQIATDKTMFAMPETAIGFFPDVGAMQYLTQCKRLLGKYIALTAGRFGEGDMCAAKLASHYEPDMNCDALIGALSAETVVEKALSAITSTPPASALVGHGGEIEALFAPDTIHDIIAALNAAGTPFASETLKTLNTRSPSSLAVTAEQYRRILTLSFDEIIAQDFTLAKNFMRSPDIYEGIRAVLIDKDGAPQWRPSQVQTISAEDILRYFTPRGAALLSGAAS